MGKSVRIADLARDLIVLSGKNPEDIRIEFTGLRPGEKLYEELITEGEGIVETGHDKIMVVQTASAFGLLSETLLADLYDAAAAYDPQLLRVLLGRCVPEYASGW